MGGAFEQGVSAALSAGGAYLALGAMAAAPLHARGLAVIDPAARGAGIPFRVLITPGMIALWPLLLWKWRQTRRHGSAAGPLEWPVSARGIRIWHAFAVRLLAAAGPIVIAAALLARPPEIAGAGIALQDPPPAAGPVRELGALFGPLPVQVRVRGGESAAAQLECEVATDLEIPALGIFWAAGAPDGGLPPDAAYLGPLWGPGLRRYALPAPHGGRLVLYSLARREFVADAALP